MDKVRQWSLLTAVGVLAVFAAGWFLLVSPQRSHASDLRTQASSQEQSNDQLSAQVAALRAQQKTLPKQQARLAQIAVRIPDNPALPPLIRSLSDAADGAGVDLTGLAPAQPTLVTVAAAGQPVAAGAAAGQTQSSAAATPLAQIPVTISATGTYFNLEQFLSSLENLRRALKVTGFTLTPAQSAAVGGTAGTSGPAPGSLTASIKAVVYMSPPAATPTAPLQPAAAPANK